MNRSSQNLGFDPERLKRIDEWMQRNIDLKRFTGSSVLLARHGEIAHLSCAGHASLARDLAYQRDTIVRIYSMTKMVTSLMFMSLLERGLTHLDTPVSEFLPEFSDCQAIIPGATSYDQLEPAPPPTLAQLLTHTSGLTYSFNESLAAHAYRDNRVDFDNTSGGLDNAVKQLCTMPLSFQPGTNWEYSVGIDVIGRVLEIMLAKPLDQILQDNIFDPLGMNDTHFALPHSKIDRFADCYYRSAKNEPAMSERAQNSSFLEGKVDTFSGGGGLVSTLDDYFRFGEMVRRGGEYNGTRIISPHTLALMRRNFLKSDIASLGTKSFAEMPMDGMGFGIGGAVVIDPAHARTPGSIGDFGWGGMASTFFWTDPILDLTCVFFTQLIPSSSYPNRAELKALVHGALVEK